MSGLMPTLPQGTLLNGGRYRVDRMLGEGGFGVVYLAMHLELQSLTAIKVTTDIGAISRQAFLDEARLLSRLRHPHLPRVTDYFIEAHQPCLVMDYIAGKDLDQLLYERNAPLNEDEVRTWTVQILDALKYLHSQMPPVIHRDIKPGNIRLAANGNVYLVDFGIAKVGDDTTRTQRAGQAISPPFSPPEQYGGSERTDARSDIYALGATLYVLLTRKLPPDVPARQVGVPFLPPRQMNPAISGQIEQIIDHMMQMSPIDRYATVQEIAAALAMPVKDTHPSASTHLIVAKTQIVRTGYSCPRCGLQPITAHAPFCHACGTPILLAFPSTGRLLDSPTDLVAVCDAAWQDAVRHIQNGTLVRWLEAYGHVDLLAKIRAASVCYPSDTEAALELFLRPNPLADLTVTPSKLDFGVCQLDVQPSAILTLHRRNPGLIHGTVNMETLWLRSSTVGLRFGPHETNMQIIISVDLARLITDDLQHDYTSALEISTNRGCMRIPVTIRVSNPPRVRLSATDINLGRVESCRRVGGSVVIINEGGGSITGKVHAEQPWLTIEARLANFRLGSRQQATVHFGITTEQLSPRGEHYGRLTWETSVGTFVTEIRLDVTPPYRLNLDDPATAIKQMSDLIKLCDCIQGQGCERWARSLEWLRDGRIVVALRFLGENDLAQQVAQMACEGDRNLAMETLMRICGAKPPRHYKDNSRDVVKQITGVFSRKPASVAYAILNTSKRGYLNGYIRSLVSWLAIPQPRFGCLPGEEAVVEILPDYRQRTFGDLFETIVE